MAAAAVEPAAPGNINSHAAEAASTEGHRVVPDASADESPTRRSSLATLSGEDSTATQASSLESRSPRATVAAQGAPEETQGDEFVEKRSEDGSVIQDDSLAQQETTDDSKQMSGSVHNPWHHHPDHYHYDWHDDHPEWHDEHNYHRHRRGANFEDKMLGRLIGNAFGGGGGGGKERSPIDDYFASGAGNTGASGKSSSILKSAAKAISGAFR